MLRESDIRNEKHREGMNAASERDLKNLLSYRHQFVHVNCPACDVDNSIPAFTKDTLAFVKCQECETVYMTPRPTPSILSRFYAESENYSYWNKYVFPDSEASRRKNICRPRVKRILELTRRLSSPKDLLVEIGAGFGTFCQEAHETGEFSRVIAVEPSRDLANTCRAKGLEVIEKTVEDIRDSLFKASIVVSFEVIEHLYDPGKFVECCNECLQIGGLLVLTCPNIKGFDVQTLGILSDTIDKEHLNYFHPASIARLVERHNFEVIETSTPGQLDAELVRKKVLNGDLCLGNQHFLRQVLIDEWDSVGQAFQTFLADNALSSHLWLVARKYR
jgi:2-polyprenyl-3-methyl-5-hydroxy-6-metoxy-1,4-benzoquinol methylase/ribosomal protein S27E